MAAPARFLFDLDFAEPEPTPAPKADASPARPVVDLDVHVAEVAAATERGRAEGLAAGRKEGREQGFVEGRGAVEARAAERLADEAARLVAMARSIFASLDAERLAVEKQAIELAVRIARKLAGRVIEREPTAEIRALVADTLGPLRKAPHLVLRLAEVDADPIRGEVERIARETGFDGRIVILGEPDLPRGDCRIEWADGGIVRDGAAVEAEIDAAVSRYLEARDKTTGRRPHTDPVVAREKE
jgi:flagellar assembly protein FliH